MAAAYDTSRRPNPDVTAALVRLLDAPPGARLLDVGCGTGNYAVELETRGYRVTGVDLARGMLERAQTKLPPGHPLAQGDARALPFGDGRFDGAFSILVLHHVPGWERVLPEARRVLRGGRYVALLSTREQLLNFWLFEYFPEGLDFLAPGRPLRDEALLQFRKAGFREAAAFPFDYTEHSDGALMVGRRNPELYLDENVRAGISIFARMATEAVAAGVARLRAHIESGHIRDVMARYDAALGDATLFVGDV